MSSLVRCPWVGQNKPHYNDYHDQDWGVPVHDDRLHFEMLILEGAQAGLNWETILKRRDGYRAAFDNFDVQKVAQYGESKIQSLLQDTGIIRNKLKVRSAVKNAQAFIKIQEEFGTFDAYIWGFVNDAPIVNAWEKMEDVPITTDISDALSKDLKKRGMSFVGSTIIYAHMQAIGVVNDHLTSCFRYHELS